MLTLPADVDDLDVWMRGRLVFSSFEAAASSACKLLAAAVGVVPVTMIVDECHMVTLDMSYRPMFRAVWAIGACFAVGMSTLILTATLRPGMETEIMLDLGLEDCTTFNVIRSVRVSFTRTLTPAPQVSE